MSLGYLEHTKMLFFGYYYDLNHFYYMCLNECRVQMYIFLCLSCFLMHIKLGTYLVVRKFHFSRKKLSPRVRLEIQERVGFAKYKNFIRNTFSIFTPDLKKTKLISRSETNPFKTKRKSLTHNMRDHVPSPLMHTKITQEQDRNDT